MSDNRSIVRYVHRADVLHRPGDLEVRIAIDASALRRAQAALSKLRATIGSDAARMLPWQRPDAASVIDQEPGL